MDFLKLCSLLFLSSVLKTTFWAKGIEIKRLGQHRPPGTIEVCSGSMLRRRIRIEIIGWIQIREKRLQIRITRVDILYRGLYFSLGPYFPPDIGLKKCPSERQKNK